MEALSGSVGLGIGAALLVIAALGFLRGMFKGAFRSVMDVAFVLLNAVLSLFISKGIAKAILNSQKVYDMLISLNEKLNNEAIENLIATIEPYLGEGEFFATADLSLVLALPTVIIAPVIFLLIYLIMGLLLKIVKFILQKLFVPKTDNFVLKLVGGALGAIRYVLALVIFMVPIIGYATYGVETMDAVSQVNENVGIEEQEELNKLVNGGTIGVVNKCGGRWFFGNMSSVKIQGVKVSLTDETEHVISVYEKVLPLSQIDTANYTSDDTAKMDEAISEIEKSEYLTALVTSVLSQVATEVRDKNGFMSYQLPDYGEILNPVVDCVIEFFASINKEGLVSDLRTYADVFEGMAVNGLFKELNDENGDLYRVLENGKFYSDILTALYINERTRPIVPTVSDAMQKYLYKVYEEVNGVPYHNGVIESVDQSKLNAMVMEQEGGRIGTAVREIRLFTQTIVGIEYVDEMVKVGNFAALGRGLNQIRDSVFFGGSYHFLIDALLHSDTCANVGIFDSNFIESASKPDADMEKLLLSRQNLATLTIAMWHGDKAGQEDSLKMLIEHVIEDDSDALKELASLENLDKYGVRGEKGQTISAITVSLADTIHTHEFTDKNGDGSIEDEKHEEAEKTAHILTAINNAHDNSSGAENMFDNGDGESKTGESAEQLVNNILDSEIAIEMMDSATKESEEDPYNLDDNMTDADRASMKDVLASKYGEAQTDEEKAKLNNIATIFGVTLVP